MPTQTTVQFQIAVSSTDENEQTTEKLFLVDMSVTSETGEVLGIELVPTANSVSSSSNDNESMQGPLLIPTSEVILPQDPPRAQIAISIAA